MPLMDYLVLDCCELVNHRRTQAYRAALGCQSPITVRNCCQCQLDPGSPWPCDLGPFVSPAVDYAACTTAGPGTLPPCPWWVDPLVPESFDVAGLWMVGFEELTSTSGVSTAPLVVGGQTFGVRRNAGRTITATFWIDARTCCASRYMVQALQNRLSSCSGSIYVMECCPEPGEPDPLRHLLEIPGAVLTQPVTVLDKRGKCCLNCTGSAVKVQVTWAAPQEDMWLGIEEVCTGAVPNEPCPIDPCDFDASYWSGLLAGQSRACDCPAPFIQPPIPGCCNLGDPTPITPTRIATGCWIPPQQFAVVPCELPSLYKWLPSSMSIEIQAGAVDIPFPRIVAFQKAIPGEPCVTNSADFIARYRCVEPLVDVRFLGIPAQSVINIDTVRRNITIRYPGSPYPLPAWNFVDAIANGSVIQALDFGTCGEVCVYMIVPCGFDSQGAEYTISMRPRKQSSF